MAPRCAPYDWDTKLTYNNTKGIADESIPDSVWKSTNRVRHIFQRLGKQTQLWNQLDCLPQALAGAVSEDLQRKAVSIATAASSPLIRGPEQRRVIQGRARASAEK